MVVRELHQPVIDGRIDEGVNRIRAALDEVGVNLPNGRRAATARLAAARARLRVRGYRLSARGAPSHDLEPMLERCFAAANALTLVDGLLAGVLQTRYLLLALRAGDPRHAARGLAAEAIFLADFSAAARRRAESVLARADALSDEPDSQLSPDLTTAARGYLAATSGHLVDARAAWDRAAPLLAESDDGWPRWLELYRWRQAVDFYLGDLRKLALDSGGHYGELLAETGHGNFRWLVRGDPDRARAALEPAAAEGEHVPEMSFRVLLAAAQIDLYRGGAGDAWQRIGATWPELADTRVLRRQQTRVEAHLLRARAALACADAGDNRDARLADAEHDVAEVERERVPWTSALSRMLRAALVYQRGDRDAAIAWLRAAEGDLDRRGLALHLAAARRRHGELTTDRDRIDRADRWLRDHGVADPDRLVAVLAPGFGGHAPPR